MALSLCCAGAKEEKRYAQEVRISGKGELMVKGMKVEMMELKGERGGRTELNRVLWGLGDCEIILTRDESWNGRSEFRWETT